MVDEFNTPAEILLECIEVNNFNAMQVEVALMKLYVSHCIALKRDFKTFCEGLERLKLDYKNHCNDLKIK